MRNNSNFENVAVWIAVFLAATIFTTTKTISMIADDKKSNFKTKFLRIARTVLAPFKMDPNLAMAQAALESNYGESELTVKANNLFGMTPGSAWLNAMNKKADFNTVPKWSTLEMGTPVIYFKTREYSQKSPDSILYWDFVGDIVDKKDDGNGGSILTVNRPFRKYLTWDESITDWAKHISSLTIYKTAFAAAQTGDINSFASGLQGKWATDPNYAKSIVATAATLSKIPEATV